MSVKIEDRVYVSPAGFWHVWRLKNGFGIYNTDGVKVAEVNGTSEYRQKQAEAVAVALDKWQR